MCFYKTQFEQIVFLVSFKTDTINLSKLYNFQTKRQIHHNLPSVSYYDFENMHTIITSSKTLVYRVTF